MQVEVDFGGPHDRGPRLPSIIYLRAATSAVNHVDNLLGGQANTENPNKSTSPSPPQP